MVYQCGSASSVCQMTWQSIIFVKMKFLNHSAKCEHWNGKLLTQRHNLPSLYPKYYKKWLSIDIEKDKSLSAQDFRLWLYLRKCDDKRSG